ncbi:hypothetical protein [Bacteroides neonati]|uniref:hypothetical protein n=1 Tax=Bacteroides neonati TaxID=1347393 RepID=UPI0005A8B2C9|nr:hypothetical protein [Bacteroides neonati]
MKNKIILVILSALVLLGCQTFDVDVPYSNGRSELMVHLDIPAPVVAKTRAGITDELSSLYVLVFDKNGLYLSKHNGELVSSTTTTANYKFGSIPTTKEGELLILHFVANYDWTSFPDAGNVGKSEAEVMNTLSVTSGTVAYWQRIELPGGLVGAKNSTITLKDDVSLLRNIAKITVTNLTNEPVENSYLTDVSFAVGGYLNRGTVAPYSTSHYSFIKGAITEALDGHTVSITDESDFVSAQNGSIGSQSVAKNIYERKNSTARDQTYVILKGYYQKTSIPSNSTRVSYYKIDLVDSHAAKELLDIERNYHYIIQVNNVAMEGYPTLQEAIDNPASNNINAAIQVAEYTSVSDGTYVLQVEKTVFSFVKPGQDFQINYSYYDVSTGTVDNSKVTVTLEQDAAMKVIADGSFTDTQNGVISARTAAIPVNNDIYQATFIVAANNSNLSRRITVRLRKPMNFVNVSSTPNNGSTDCVVANMVGQPVTITFAFPPDISPAVFPLPVYVYSKKLSPDPTKMGVDALSIDPLPNNTFRYVYMAPYKGNDANDVPHTHTIYLVSSTTSSNEDVILTSDYFNDVTINLRSASIPALSNVSFNPNPVFKLKDEPVQLTFDIPVVADNTLPYHIRIHTDYLAYVSTATGLDCVWDEELGVYIYTTNTTGNQRISFKTKQPESSGYVRIDGDRFAAITVRRTTLLGEFKDVSVDVSGKTAGSAANITLSVDEAGTRYIAGGGDVYFNTQYLTPAVGSGMVSTGIANEYKMSVSSGGVKTASFILNKDLPVGEAETIKISSANFKDYFAKNVIPGKFTFGSNVPGYENRPVLTIKNSDTPVSLSAVAYWETFNLRFSIPPSTRLNGAVLSDTNPLYVCFESTNDLYLRSYTGISSSIPSTYQNARTIWFKITSTGDKVVAFDANRANDNSVLSLMSVKSGETISNGVFETATGFQDR